MHVGCKMCDKLKMSMKKNLSRIFLIVVCGLVAVGCSEYSKLLKSNNFDANGTYTINLGVDTTKQQAKITIKIQSVYQHIILERN